MNFKRLSRKTHRYFGIIIGIQFIFWTLGGLYFSWSNIDKIHGDHLRNLSTPVYKSLDLSAFNIVAQTLQSDSNFSGFKQFKLVQLPQGDAISFSYQLTDPNGKIVEKQELFELNTQQIREEISQETAIAIAQNSLKEKAKILTIQRIEQNNLSKHHEYRSGKIPAYAIEIEGKPKLMIYIDAKTGEVVKFRTKNWRIFDFLWMMHTMDYASRDNLNNWLLRLFSILGLITIVTGFVLYFSSSKVFRKKT